jgi:hypothetical protein
VSTSLLITDLKERGDDCSSKLTDTWKSIDAAKQKAEQNNQ